MEKTLTKKPFYECGEVYSFTLNPDDKCQFVGKADRLQRFKNFVYELFVQLDSHGVEYAWEIDISEPRKINGNYPRLHIHGVLHFAKPTAIRHFLLMWLPMIHNHCYFDIDTCDDIEIWEEYCKKYKHITKMKTFTNKKVREWKYFYGEPSDK